MSQSKGDFHAEGPTRQGTSPSRTTVFPNPQDDRVAQILDTATSPEDIELASQGETAENDQNTLLPPDFTIPTSTTRRLYISHSLSTFNSRSFEFGAVLFLAVIYPETLLPMSVYALVRSASAIIFAPWVGRTIDTRNRLTVVRFSIIAQRATVALSCVVFLFLLMLTSLSSRTRDALFSMIVIFACVEKNASVMNTVAVERDWAVAIAERNESNLRTLNARMRRIDLICKLCGPLFIALINGASTKIAMLTTLGLNITSVVIEYFAIAQVYTMTPSLQTPKASSSGQSQPALPSGRTPYIISRLSYIIKSLKFYWQSPAFLPSFSLSLLYLTVLSFSGQMVTYLLNSGYTSFIIALTRTLSVVVELSATWVAPRVMKRIGATRSGMWFLSIQMIFLAAGLGFFWAESRPIVAASGLVAGTILSRVGLWGFDLSAQFIIQDEIQADSRGSFSATEAALQNFFELLSYVTTIIFPHPSEFRYPSLISAIAVYISGGLYGAYLRKRRGHLLHLDTCIKGRHHSAD